MSASRIFGVFCNFHGVDSDSAGDVGETFVSDPGHVRKRLTIVKILSVLAVF